MRYRAGAVNILLPTGIAVDGLGNVFTSNFTAHQGAYHPGALQIFSNSGSLLTPTTGLYGTTNNTTQGMYVNPMPISPTASGLAIDGSGNVWVAGNTGGNSGINTITKYVTVYVGLAAPVATPMGYAIANNKLGVRP